MFFFLLHFCVLNAFPFAKHDATGTIKNDVVFFLSISTYFVCFFLFTLRCFLCWLHFSILIELKCSFLYNLKFKKWSIWNGIDVNILTIVALRFGIFFSFSLFSFFLFTFRLGLFLPLRFLFGVTIFHRNWLLLCLRLVYTQ